MSVLTTILAQRGLTKEQLTPFKAVKLNFPELEHTVASLFGLYFCSPNARTGILYDVDVDGLFSGEILNDFLQRLRRPKPFVMMNKHKQHGITREVIDWVIANQIEWLFVVDAGSGDHEAHAQLSQMGVNVVVLDHHPYNKPDSLPHNVWVVNPIHDPSLPLLSGAGVVYRFIEQVALMLGIQVKDYEKLVGLTVLSDMCSMLDKENRYYVDQLYRHYPENLLFKTVHEAGHFYGSKLSLFSFKIIPFLNAMIRIGNEQGAMEIVHNMHRQAMMKRVPAMMESAKSVQESLKAEIRASSVVKEKPHVVTMLRHAKADSRHLNTLNGLLGNELTGDYKKDAMVLAYDSEQSVWSGSFRGVCATYDDLRAYGFKATGHPQACGVVVNQENLKRFVNEYVPTVKNLRIADLDINSGQISSADFLEIAHFNEMTGTGLPPVRFNFKQGIRAVIDSEIQGKREILRTEHERIIDFKDTDSATLILQPSCSKYEEEGYQLLRQY